MLVFYKQTNKEGSFVAEKMLSEKKKKIKGQGSLCFNLE